MMHDREKSGSLAATCPILRADFLSFGEADE